MAMPQVTRLPESSLWKMGIDGLFRLLSSSYIAVFSIS
jgi:hypothetical protein